MKHLIKRMKTALLKRIYRKNAADLQNVIHNLITFETRHHLSTPSGSVQDQIKKLYERINDTKHISELYERNIVILSENCKHLFDDYCLDNDCFFVRELNTRHNRKHLLLTCIRKNAKTIFQLKLEN